MPTVRLYKVLLWVQSVYFLITALWALLHIESFMDVSGRKADIWLVKTVSVLILAIAICLFSGIFYHRQPVPVLLLAFTSAAGLAAIDFYYTSAKVIKWVYAVDGFVELLFLIAGVYLLLKRKKI